MGKYDYKPFKYHRPAGLDSKEPRHKAVIVGAGPIGLAMAIDLALRGVKSVVLDDNDVVSVGSRAICWAFDISAGVIRSESLSRSRKALASPSAAARLNHMWAST